MNLDRQLFYFFANVSLCYAKTHCSHENGEGWTQIFKSNCISICKLTIGKAQSSQMMKLRRVCTKLALNFFPYPDVLKIFT